MQRILHQEPAHLPQYIGFFVVGVVDYRHMWFSRMSTAQVRLWRWVALTLVPLFPVLAVAAGALRGEMDPAVTGGFTWLSLAYSLCEGFMGTAMVIVVLVRRRDPQAPGCKKHPVGRGRIEAAFQQIPGPDAFVVDGSDRH